MTKNSISQVFLSLFILSLFLKSRLPYTSIISILSTYVFSFVGIVSLIVNFGKLRPKELFFLGLLIFFSSMSALLGDNYRIQDFALSISFFGVALIPLHYRLNYKMFFYLLIVSILFFIKMIIEGENPNDIFVVSRNFISVFLLVVMGFYYIASFQNNKEINIILLFIALFIAFWAVGRSGIISFSLLILSYPMQKRLSFSKSILLYLVLGLLATFLVIKYSDTIFQTTMYRIENEGFNEGARESINSLYIQSVFNNPRYLLWGVPLDSISVVRELALNPHNSYIRLHIFYGLFGFLSVMSMIFYSMSQFFMKRNYMYFFMLFVLSIRAFFDSAAFFGPLDPLFYFFMLNTLQSEKFKKKENENISIKTVETCEV